MFLDAAMFGAAKNRSRHQENSESLQQFIDALKVHLILCTAWTSRQGGTKGKNGEMGFPLSFFFLERCILPRF